MSFAGYEEEWSLLILLSFLVPSFDRFPRIAPMLISKWDGRVSVRSPITMIWTGLNALHLLLLHLTFA